MNTIIIGGGKVGKDLARIMLDARHEVSVIEKDRKRCELIANELDIKVIHGDGTDVRILESVIIKDCDCLIAVTGSDQDNLVASQLAKNHFAIPRVISRVSNPRNTETFHALDIKDTVSSTEIISKMIEQEADTSDAHLLTVLNKGEASISSIRLLSESSMIGKSLKDIDFPDSTLIISVIREDKLTIPDGSFVLDNGDELIVLSNEKGQKHMQKLASGK